MKTLHLLFLMLLVSCLSMTAWAQINSFPHDEGFENGGSIPTNWTQEYVSASVDWAFATQNQNGSATARTGTYLARFYSPNYDSDATRLVTPQLDLTGLTNGARVKFYYTQVSWAGDLDELRVYYKTSSGGAWNIIGTYTSEVLSWTEVVLNLPSPSADYYIAFEGTSGYGRGVTIDDVTIEEVPSCSVPSAMGASAITSTSATLGWTAGGSETTWNLEWKAGADFTPGTGAEDVAATTSVNPVSMSSLTAQTTYYVYYQADCGGGDMSSWAGPYTFTTACAVVSTFPYTENFDGGANGWISGGTNSSWALGTPADDVINSAASGANSWMTNLTGDYNSSENSYVMSPCFNMSSLTAPRVSLSYWVESETSWDGALLQYTTDGTTWNTIGSMSSGGTNWYNDGTIGGLNWADSEQDGWTGTGSTAWATATHDVFALAGESSVIFRIAFGSDGSSNDDGFAFDDFMIEDVTCPAPSGMAAGSITENSADLTWTETGTATTWDLEWKAGADFTPGTGAEDGSTSPTTTAAYTMSSLTAATQYYVYYRSDCGGSESDWAGPYNFSTAIPTAQGVTCTTPDANSSVIFTENFEDNSQGWTGNVGVGNGNWEIPDGSTSSGTGPSDGYNGGNYTNYEASNTNSNTGAMVSPAINLSGSVDDAELSFWMHAYGANMGTLNVGVGTSAGGPFTNVFTWSGQLQTSAAEAWQNVGVDLSAYVGQTIYIQFEQVDDQGGYEGDMSIDLVEVTTCQGCPAPSTMAAGSITSSSADLTWTENGSATTWNIEWKAGADFTPGTGAEDGSTSPTTTPAYSMSSLMENTTYYVYYQSDCGGDESSWVGPYTFTTLCGSEALPWTEDFESMPAVGGGVIPDCWFEDGDWTSANATGNNNRKPNGGTHYMYTAWAADDWLITPGFDLTGGTAYTFSFYYVTDGNAGWTTLEAAYGTAQDGASMTNAIGTPVSGPTNTDYALYSVSFTPASTGTYYIGVHVVASGAPWYMSFDDWDLRETPAADAEVTNLALPTGDPCSSLSATETITVTVKNNGASPIAIGDASVALAGVTATPQTNAGEIASGATEDIDFTVDMTTDQTYNITATVTLAGDSDVGNNSQMGSVTSGVGEATSPFSCDFTGFTGANIDVCSGFIEANGDGTPVEGDSDWTSSSVFGVTTARHNIFSNNDDEWIITPTFDCGPTTAFAMEIAITNWNSSDPDADGMAGTDDAVYVKVSTDCGTNWTTVKTFNDANTTGIISNTLTRRVIDLSAYDGQTIQVGIHSTDGSTDDGPDYDFHIGNPRVDDIANIPVELSTFTATAEGAVNLLQWTTVSEINNAYFDVERSTNGVEFETIGTVEGNGTTVEISNYSFIDNAPEPVSYYRLRQVDTDGPFEYSNVIVVKRDGAQRPLSIAPNPAKNHLNVLFEASTETTRIRVFDVRGKLVRNIEKATDIGENNITLEIAQLGQGMYFLEVISGSAIQRKSFIKQ